MLNFHLMQAKLQPERPPTPPGPAGERFEIFACAAGTTDQPVNDSIDYTEPNGPSCKVKLW